METSVKQSSITPRCFCLLLDYQASKALARPRAASLLEPHSLWFPQLSLVKLADQFTLVLDLLHGIDLLLLLSLQNLQLHDLNAIIGELHVILWNPLDLGESAEQKIVSLLACPKDYAHGFFPVELQLARLLHSRLNINYNKVNTQTIQKWEKRKINLNDDLNKRVWLIVQNKQKQQTRRIIVPEYVDLM